MAKKEKEVCPYCGKAFVYLNRHKCKNKPDEEQVVDIEQVKLSDDAETKPIEKPVQKPLKPKEIPPKEDIIVETHSETVRFLSKFIKPEAIKLEKGKDKNILRDVLKIATSTLFSWLLLVFWFSGFPARNWRRQYSMLPRISPHCIQGISTFPPHFLKNPASRIF